MKNFLLKSSFHSRNIQIFVCLFSPLFFTAAHCFWGWKKTNLKVYDVTNYTVGRGFLAPLFYEHRLSILLTPPPSPFSDFVQPTSNLHPHCSFSWLNFFDWMGNHATFDVLFYLMILWTYTCRRTLLCL